MEKAVDAVREGMSQRTAAIKFNVPRISLLRRVGGKHTKPIGPPTVLSQAEEETFANTLGVVAKWGFPLNRVDVRDVIKKYLDKQGKEVVVFKNNTPGPDFLDSFITRNNLSIRTASNIKRSRSSVNRDDILKFFNNAEVALEDVKRINLYNYDETNVTDDDRPRNTKRVERVQEHSRASISIMVCGNANGDLLPPMVVYKALNIYENWTQSGPVGTKYASRASGWFDMNLFEMWFFSILLPHVEATREAGDTVVLLGDNLASHFSPKTSGEGKAGTPGASPKEQFPVLLGRLWSGISDSVSQNLVSGFRATGLHPPNPTEVLKRMPDGLDDAGEVVERNIDASLRELLQEHRGSGEKQKRKRRKKIEPVTTASAVNIEETELNVEEAQPNEEEGSETATMSEVSISVSINQNKPSTSASQNIIKQRPVRETRKLKRVDSSICGICRINWNMTGCNGASTDPYYNCPRCEDTDDEEVDDSEEDKDFVPSD
ncbi:hypothetical protein NQ318_009141 [Aromia moschata]|uniref:HTH psq-type domain-containing protein n=1 Tax=Aromia moschata TaxID=1265417 RepID=A0AAV8X990_9CUCU|nr:hypothetical protein NQ318_009141 [Aromia moschata]